MNDKIKVMDKMLEKADYVLLGGGIASTFLTAKGYDLKKSIFDENSLDYAKQILEKYNDKIILPVDGYGSLEYADNLEVFNELKLALLKTINHKGEIFGNTRKECGNYKCLSLDSAKIECERYYNVLNKITNPTFIYPTK